MFLAKGAKSAKERTGKVFGAIEKELAELEEIVRNMHEQDLPTIKEVLKRIYVIRGKLSRLRALLPIEMRRQLSEG